MLAFLPIIGPIIQGISGIVSSFTNLAGVKLTTASQTVIAETQASASIIAATQDSIGLRLMRDLVCFPVVVWSFLMSWDTIVADRYPEWMWHTSGFPDSVGYIPYAVMVFLLGNVGLNMWSRK